MNSYEMSRQYSQFKSKVQGSDKKAAQAATTTTPVVTSPSSITSDNKKRKRPISSTSEDTPGKVDSFYFLFLS